MFTDTKAAINYGNELVNENECTSFTIFEVPGSGVHCFTVVSDLDMDIVEDDWTEVTF